MNAPVLALDATRILPKLYQGSTPATSAAVVAWTYTLVQRGFRTVVFCAQEMQPPTHLLTGLEVLRSPIDDDFDCMPEADWIRSVATAERVARRVRDGDKVLVVCAMGRNRSGLVNALALHMLTGMPGRDAVARIRNRRAGALTNPRFVERLRLLR